MNTKEYVYNPDRLVTLIRQTKKNRKIWSVESTTNAWVENIFRSNPGYNWEVDCDLDTYVVHQDEIESEDVEREVSKRTESSWKTYLLSDGIAGRTEAIGNLPITSVDRDNTEEKSILTKEVLENWLDDSFSQLTKAYKKQEYPYEDLLPIIAQDREGKILMLAWGNRGAIMAGFETGLGNYFSRSRNKFWTKGEESGHTQRIFAWTLEQKFPYSIIYRVDQKGAACHTGEYSCFFRELKVWNDPGVLPR